MLFSLIYELVEIMDTPFTNAFSRYGFYVKKEFPVLAASQARILERERNENAAKLHIANTEIREAHEHLDKIGIPRLQDSGRPFSLAGRLSLLVMEMPVNG